MSPSMSTFVGPPSCTTFAVTLCRSSCALRRKPRPGSPSTRFHHLSYHRNEPGTAVDSSFQVLLCLERNDTFETTAQKPSCLVRRSEQRCESGDECIY